MPAYNNPYTFYSGQPNAYAGNYQPYVFPYPASTVQNQPQVQQQSSLLTVFVDSEEEVNMYPVAAGVTVILICFKLRKFYLKTTGKNGVPEPLRVFSFTEEALSNTATGTNQNSVNPIYASAEALENISNKLNDLIAKLGGDE